MKPITSFLWAISPVVGLYLIFFHSNIWGLAFLLFFSLSLKPKHGLIVTSIVSAAGCLGLHAIQVGVDPLANMLFGGFLGLLLSPIEIRIFKQLFG